MTADELIAWRMSQPAPPERLATIRPGPNPEHLTQAEAAEVLGCSVGAIRDYESARSPVHAAIAQRIADLAKQPSEA